MKHDTRKGFSEGDSANIAGGLFKCDAVGEQEKVRYSYI